MSENLKNLDEEEFRAEQSEKVIEFLERSGAYEYFQDVLTGKEEAPYFVKFKDFLIRINGIARDAPICGRKFDGVNVGLSSFIEDVVVPKHEDKEELLKGAYESVPNVAGDDIKYMLPAVINAVHLFNDGNGRTSRVVHLLLSRHLAKEDFLKAAQKALGEFGRFDALDINPRFVEVELEQEVLKRHGWIFDEDNPQGKLGAITQGLSHDILSVDGEEECQKLAREFFAHSQENMYYAETAIYMALGSSGIAPLFKKYSQGDERRGGISKQRMLGSLSAADWRKIIDNYWQLKKEEAKTLVDIFKNPDKYKTENDKPIKDVFIERVNKQSS